MTNLAQSAGSLFGPVTGRVRDVATVEAQQDVCH